MAIPYLNNIDLRTNELQYAVIQPSATDPIGLTPKLGQIYFNNIVDKLTIYTSLGWVTVGGGITAIPTLQEVTDEGAITTNKITVNVSNNLPAIIASNTTGLGLFASSDDFVVGRFNLDTASNNSNIVEFLKNNVLQSYITHNGTIVGNKSLINTTVDNGVDALQVNGSLIATAIKKLGGLSTEFLKADGSIDSNTYLTSASNYWTKVGNNIVKNNTGNVYFSGDGSSDLGTGYIASLDSITISWNNGSFNTHSIGIQDGGSDGITMFINNSDTFRGWVQTGRNLTLNTTYSIGFIDFMINSVSKLKLNNNGTLKYATDVSSLYDARTLIDKGYADATYLTSANNYWTKTGNDIQNNNTGIVNIKPSTRLLILNASNTPIIELEPSTGKIITKANNGGIFGSDEGTGLKFPGDRIEFIAYNGSTGTAFNFNSIYASFNIGTSNLINYSPTINPISGNAIFNLYNISPTVNQTGGASGITRGIYINPTLTSAADFRAIEVTAGKSIFQELNATSFIKSGGTSGEFLKADGSVSTGQLLPSYLEFNNTDKTVWNNGQGNVSSNTSFGDASLVNNTTGNNNTAIGASNLYSNTTGVQNTAVGANNLNGNTTGSANIALGFQTLIANTTGNSNIGIGRSALEALLSGSNNLGIGSVAGLYLTNGSDLNTTSNESIFIGGQSKSSINNQTNQIVIGYNAIGAGSNTVTLGNTSITSTRLRGSVLGGSFVKDGGTSSQYLMADGSVTTGGGGSTKSINSVSTNTAAGSASSTDYFYFASSTINITLPTAVGNQNLYIIKNVGTGVITVNTTSSQTIDGSLTAPIIVQYLSLTIISDGANWNII